jgi:hypothetical protein
MPAWRPESQKLWARERLTERYNCAVNQTTSEVSSLTASDVWVNALGVYRSLVGVGQRVIVAVGVIGVARGRRVIVGVFEGGGG